MASNCDIGYPKSFLTSNLFYGLHPLHNHLEGIFGLTCQSKQLPRRRLLDLPLELIVNILTELEWREVLKVRQTCKALQQASKERPVWLNLFNQQVLLVLDEFKLDYPIELYTNQELERYTLRFISSDMVWSTDATKPFVIRHQIPCTEGGHFYLSDSGRWLLILAENGCVDYYDLDDPVAPKRPLIPALTTAFEEGIMAVDVDPHAPNLTFRLALYTGYGGFVKQRIAIFQIWHVRLVFEGKEKQPYLTAQKLASFSQDTPGIFCDMSLHGDTFAYSVSNSLGQYPAFVVLIEWKVISPTPDLQVDKLHYPKRILYPKDGTRNPYIRLLPGSRMFVLCEFWAQLFDYSELETTEIFIWDEIPSERYTPCSWKQSVAMPCFHPDTLSSAFVFQKTNTIKLVAAGWTPVFGFVIPLYGDHPAPRMVKFTDSIKDLGLLEDYSYFGRHKALLRSISPTGTLTALSIRYSWPGEAGEVKWQLLRRNVFGPPRSVGATTWRQARVTFNEFTGRVLVFPVGHRSISLFGLAWTT